jgi:hypothetical protein
MRKRCVVCPNTFTASRADAKTCSPRCRRKLSRHLTWYPISVTGAAPIAQKPRPATTLPAREKRQKMHEISKGNQGAIIRPNALSVTSSVPIVALYRGRSRKPMLRLVPFGPLYRIEWPDIGLSDLVNITRAKAAALERAQRQCGDDKLSWRVYSGGELSPYTKE